MNWKNDGIWLFLLIPIVGLMFALGVNAGGDIISLLLIATLIILFIIRWNFKRTHKE